MAKVKPRGKKTGPKGPMKPMDDKMFEQVKAMVRIQCTRKEVAGIVGMCKETLNLRIKEYCSEKGIEGVTNFSSLQERFGNEGKASLRRMQWQSADSGSVQMQVWLGKQMLSQRDKIEQDNTSSDGSHNPGTIIIKAAGRD